MADGVHTCFQCGKRIATKEACWVRKKWTCQACVQKIIDDLKAGGYNGAKTVGT